MNSSAIDLRPKTWDEVIGHRDVVNSLQTLLEDKTPVAVGFSGPAGHGKTTLAYIVARSIQPEFDPELLDIRHVNCADCNGVDEARAWAEDANYHPHYGKRKVYILDEAHMLTVQAQNALLLPTEPQHDPSTLWIVCTTDTSRLIPALKSRIAWFELKPFKSNEIKELLEVAARQVGVSFPQDLFEQIVKNNLTSPRDVLYAYDKYLAGYPVLECVPENAGTESDCYEVASALMKGWTAVAPRLATLKAGSAKNLRIAVASYMSAVLTGTSTAPKPAIAELLLRLGQIDAYEDSVALAATKAALYVFTQKSER